MTTPTIDRTGCTARRHGNPSAYNWFYCRCPDAREANRAYKAGLRNGTNPPGRIDGQPTMLRLRILAALGYDWTTLARNYGCTPPRIARLAHQRRHVYPATATQVTRLYTQLVAAPTPCGYPATRAIGNAIRSGWGVVDSLAVDRALAGTHVDLTPLEKAAVIYTGAARGQGAHIIAAAARLSYTTVTARLAA